MAIINDAQLLHDIFARYQTFLEGVKAESSLHFRQTQQALNSVFEKVLNRVDYDTLDGLTKSELNKLLAELRQSQTKLYSKYTEDIIKQLRNFAGINLNLVRKMAVATRTDEYEDAEDQDAFALAWMKDHAHAGSLYGPAAMTDDASLWAKITNAVIPANGMELGEFLGVFAGAAITASERTIRTAWADKWSIRQTLRAITGAESPQGYNGILRKVVVQNDAVIDTVIQHTSNVTVAGVLSLLFDYYIWVSIIDNRTTEICRSRNRKIYRFGEGPIPPAHIRCRSGISPIDDNSAAVDEESFFKWMKRQAANYQNEILGKPFAEQLRSGKIKADQLSKFENRRRFTAEQFGNKIGYILATKEGY